MSNDYEFQGWLGPSHDAISKMQWGTFEPKKWEEDDVDVKITHCSICGADCHMLRSGWGQTSYREIPSFSLYLFLLFFSFLFFFFLSPLFSFSLTGTNIASLLRWA
jgi:hypothetical protein